MPGAVWPRSIHARHSALSVLTTPHPTTHPTPPPPPIFHPPPTPTTPPFPHATPFTSPHPTSHRQAPLGGCLDSSFVGGSAMPVEVANFFENIGVAICEGYGLTVRRSHR